jgi:hypothetical protein
VNTFIKSIVERAKDIARSGTLSNINLTPWSTYRTTTYLPEVSTRTAGSSRLTSKWS